MPLVRRPVLRRAALPWLFFFLLAWSPARAQNLDPFSVRNVQEDIHDENLSQARNRALLAGQRDAFQTLMQRLTAQADWPRLPQPSDSELQDLVLDVGIDQEKRSAVRTLVTLSVRFKPDAIRRLLRGAGIAYADWRGRPVMVLPVWRTDAGPVLAEAPNPWRDLWRSGAVQGLVPLAVASAEQIDGVATAAQAAAAGPDLLADLGQRLNSQDVLVLVVALQKPEAAPARLDLTVIGAGPVGGMVAAATGGGRSYTAEAGETPDQMLRRAADDIARTADDGWKAGNLLQFDRSAALTVMIPLTGLDDWLGVRDKLARSTPVRSYEVAALARTEAALVLHYVGEQAQLESVLMQNGLVLTWEDDHWVLRNTARHTAVVR